MHRIRRDQIVVSFLSSFQLVDPSSVFPFDLKKSAFVLSVKS